MILKYYPRPSLNHNFDSFPIPATPASIPVLDLSYNSPNKLKVWGCTQFLLRVITWGISCFLSWPRGYKTFFMLNSTEHEIFPAHKC